MMVFGDSWLPWFKEKVVGVGITNAATRKWRVDGEIPVNSRL